MTDPSPPQPKPARRRGRVILGAVLAAAVIGGAVTTWALTREDGTDEAQSTEVAGPAAAAEAKARRTALLERNSMGIADSSDSSLAEGLTIDCTGEQWRPSPEDVAAANADSDALASTLDRYGVAYTVSEDEFGFRFVEYDYADVIAESVAASFWADRYPAQPLPADELDRIRAEIDGLAARFDDAAITYTRMSDASGWEWLDWDYTDPDAQAIADAYYTELYPPLDCDGMPMPVEPGVAPSFDDLPEAERERILAEVEGLRAAFEGAGVTYTEVTDADGYTYLEWDYEDPATQEVADAFYADFFAPDPEVVAARRARVAVLTAAFDAADVDHTVEGEADWVYVLFDIDDPAAPAAVAQAALG